MGRGNREIKIRDRAIKARTHAEGGRNKKTREARV